MFNSDICPCGSGSAYDVCCGPYHHGVAAPTAEALMRSRYSAYVLGDVAYLMNTVAPERRYEHDIAAIAAWSASAQWQGTLDGQVLGLRVHQSTQDGDDDGATGSVLFSVAFGENGKVRDMRELSEFHRQGGHWFYCGPLHQ